MEMILPSCCVDKDLLRGLEDYLKTAMGNLYGNQQEAFRDEYTLSITDSLGTEVLKSISDFGPALFSDRTQGITVEASRLYSKQELLMVRLRFHRRRASSELSINCHARNARELATALCDGLKRLLEPHRNFNWFYNPPIVVELIVFSLSPLVVFFSPAMTLRSQNIWLITSWVSAGLVVFYWVSRIVFKPYSSFDSRTSRTRSTLWNWFIYGIIGFLIFGTVFTMVRMRFFGF
ncbi:MAG: hypothetical protein AB1451_05440 [Nitrospirota bacterium]